jgi:hypothetical protein
MAGLVPAIPIMGARSAIYRDHRDRPGDDRVLSLLRLHKWNRVNSRIHHFIDAMFTTLLEALFTKAFDVIARFQSGACVWRTGRGD